MCSTAVLCPLCDQSSFASIDALQMSLIKAANGPLACPICHQLFLGLDKLTIHLFSHTTNIMARGKSSASTVAATAAAAADSLSQAAMTTTTTATTATAEQLTPSETKTLSVSSHRPIQNSPMAPIIEKRKTKKIKGSDCNQNIEGHSPSADNQSIQEQLRMEAGGTTVDGIGDASSTLSVCDICEFTFRNGELRDLHYRLVHQNGETPSLSASPDDGAVFKCHLCAKVFKMKGSLRVHLKVVHSLGLNYVGSASKASICDRIRRKDTASNGFIVSKFPTTAPETATDTSASPITLPIQLQDQSSFNLPPLGAVALVSTTTTTNNGNLVNINASGELISTADTSGCSPSSLLNSNILLVFNNAGTANNNGSDGVMANQYLHSPAVTSGIGDLDADSCNRTIGGCDNPKIWECDVCSKSFTTKYFLKKHKRLHTGEMPYTCEICARTFTFQQSYHKHLLYHSNEKPHVCGICGRAFKELSTLHNHERIHSGEKPFKCEVCGKCFRQRVSFLVHSRIHTGVMPYKCEMCQKSFRYKVSQRTHKCLPRMLEEAAVAASLSAAKDQESVDQASERFIAAFLETASVSASASAAGEDSTIIPPPPPQQQIQSANDPYSVRDKDITSMDEMALLSKTIDDIVVDSCNKMGIGSDGSMALPQNGETYISSGSFAAVDCCEGGSNSPSQKFENMHLYSPQLVMDINQEEEEVAMANGTGGGGGEDFSNLFHNLL